ncbi:MAG: ABC transporter permease, partial [Akkermansiaceae bacterium]|nr:ABC transporter permease [Armatimonadota bacterium]
DISAPIRAYQALFVGAVGSPLAWSNTLSRTMPILLTGVGVSVALAAGLFNIGAEGQLAVGGLAAAVVGFSAKGFPAPLALLAALVASAVTGAAWAFLPAYLKEKRGAHEVITAILLNYIAQNVTRYLVSNPLKDPTSGGNQRTPEVLATLPRLSPQFDVHAGLIIAIIIVLVVAVFLQRTVWGYETRMVGAGAGASEAAGIPVSRVRVRAMLVSGSLCGLAGAVLVLGVVPFKSFPADFYGAGYGFDGLAVALLAGGSAFGVLPAALLFGALGAGAEEMDFKAEIPKQIVAVVQAILIVAVAARFALPRWKKS